MGGVHAFGVACAMTRKGCAKHTITAFGTADNPIRPSCMGYVCGGFVPTLLHNTHHLCHGQGIRIGYQTPDLTKEKSHRVHNAVLGQGCSSGAHYHLVYLCCYLCNVPDVSVGVQGASLAGA